ncbi:complement C1q tumor necrosis factor-related protein 6-like [Lingula anatina]|uniref:Complement C1q tumor necrosis factor-related protein 6-like n=1 Tax=Lingula anatina TaxID=7574 RepID=A0A1S3HPT3_LINAN|nr:complement C1q tumor necrosis factor-related protein 6-like [Lingula anatina]|eukprot:XP_013387049.1 complement C1q tumor necrosis factor-related protein 6-like [Lingula anatina]
MVNGLTRMIEAERRNNTKLNHIETLVTNLQQTLQSQSSLVLKLSGQQQGLSTDLQLTKDENKRLAADLKTAKLMLNEMRNKTETDKIAFAVGRSKSQNLVASTTDIKITFDKIFSNHGSNFDAANSLFRAPVDGAYMFTMTMLSNHGSAGRVYLIRNGAYETEMFGYDTVDAATGTNQVILDLKAGDEVWLKLAKGHAIHGNGASVYFTFTGHLLFTI